MKKYKSTVSPEELSGYFREREKFSYLRFVLSSWWFLVGGLITCPICGKKAVIIPYGAYLPIEKSKHVPCFCTVKLDSGTICCHWCVKELGGMHENFSSFGFIYPSSFINPYIKGALAGKKISFFPHEEEEFKDITGLFKVLIRDSIYI